MNREGDFPTQEYVQECIEHQEELRKEWEPKTGDWVLTHQFGIGVASPFEDKIIRISLVDIPGYERACYWVDYEPRQFQKLVPLPTLGQLVRMVEGKGWDWSLVRYDGKGYRAYLRLGERYAKASEDSLAWEGPSPETAMLRAWLEVVREEK